MGNCVSQFKKKKELKRAVTLAIVGLDNAGKTTLSCVLAGEQIDPDIAPTVGFRNAKFSNSNFDISLFDVGGGKNIRPIWKTYFGEVFGIMYVVDSSSKDRLLEAKEVFRETLEHTQVSGKPVLILANKVDKEDHMKELDLVNGLDLDKVVNANKCPSKLVMVSALKGVGVKMDKEIQEGLTWLLGNIGTNWSTLEPRIQEDMRQAKDKRDKEREERRARVKKQKEEREKAEDLERTALGLEKKEESEEEDIVDGNPFKALDLENLKKKEQSMKEEKRLKEKRRSHREDLNNTSSYLQAADDTADSMMSSQRLDMTRFDLGDTRVLHLDDSQIKPSATNFLSRNNRGPALPPLEPLNSRSQEKLIVEKKKRKKRKLTEYNLTSYDNGNHGDNTTNELTLQPPKSGLWSRETEVHDLTPRIAKPKVAKVVKGKRIDEEEDDIISYPDNEPSPQQLYNNLEKSHLKSHKFDDSQSKANKGNHFKKGFETFPRDLEREDSMYRRALKNVNPPNLHSFDEEMDDNTERKEVEEKNFQNERFVASKNSFNTRQPTVKLENKLQESDEENDSYDLHNALKDTLRFPPSPRDEEAPRDFQQEIRELQQRHLNGITKANYNSYRKNKPSEEDELSKGSQDLSSRKLSPVPIKEEKHPKGETSDRSETRRKKKRNLLRSNKLAPSDDEDADSAFSEKLTSPRMVQERGSRNSSDNETPVKKSSSKLTQFHRNISHDSDFGAKWGLAEDLPAVDSDYSVRRVPNFDDSDAGDIVY